MFFVGQGGFSRLDIGESGVIGFGGVFVVFGGTSVDFRARSVDFGKPFVIFGAAFVDFGEARVFGHFVDERGESPAGLWLRMERRNTVCRERKRDDIACITLVNKFVL